VIRTQDEIVADLIMRADILENWARDRKYGKKARDALELAATFFRVAAEHNSRDGEKPFDLSRLEIEFRQTEIGLTVHDGGKK